MGPSVYHWFQDSCPTLSPGDPAVAEHRRAHRGGTQRWHHTNQWKWKIFRQLRLSCCVWKAQVIHILLNTLNWNLGFICCWCNNEPEGWGEEEMRRDERKPLTNEERDRHTPFFNLQVHLLTLNLFVLFMAIVALNQELKLRLNQRTQVCCLFQWRLHHDRCCVGDASLMWRTAASCNKVWCFLATFLHPWPSMMTHAFAIAFTQLPLNSFCNVLAGFISKGDFLKKNTDYSIWWTCLRDFSRFDGAQPVTADFRSLVLLFSGKQRAVGSRSFVSFPSTALWLNTSE